MPESSIIDKITQIHNGDNDEINITTAIYG